MRLCRASGSRFCTIQTTTSRIETPAWLCLFFASPRESMQASVRLVRELQAGQEALWFVLASLAPRVRFFALLLTRTLDADSSARARGAPGTRLCCPRPARPANEGRGVLHAALRPGCSRERCRGEWPRAGASELQSATLALLTLSAHSTTISSSPAPFLVQQSAHSLSLDFRHFPSASQASWSSSGQAMMLSLSVRARSSSG